MAIDDRRTRRPRDRHDVAPQARSVPEGLTLRRMCDDDLDLVLGIEHVAFAMPWSSITYRNLLRRRDADLSVAEIPEVGIIGYAAFWSVLDEAELGNIAVTPEYRGRGVARALLDRVLERATEKQINAMFLEVRVSNERARALYERAGFKQVGMRRNYYAFPLEDAIVMRLELPVSETPGG